MSPTVPSSILSNQVSTDTSKTHCSDKLITLIVLSSIWFLCTYLCALFVTYRYAKNHPRALNKESGVHLQRYAPAFYIFLVVSSLVESSLSGLLLVKDAYLENLPNSQSRRAVTLLLFCACWTSVTSGTYSMLFLHPKWTGYNVASIGAQALWLLVTLILWIVGAGLLNGALPQLLVKSHCGGLVYCEQVQGLFAVAVITTLALTAGLIILIWVAIGFTFRVPDFRWKGLKWPNINRYSLEPLGLRRTDTNFVYR